MACDPQLLKQVPLFANLDDDEAAVLASQVEVRQFSARQRIYKIGDSGGRGYIVVSGKVVVSTIDESGQEVPVDIVEPGNFFGFASMLEQTPHESEAVAEESTVCVEVDRHDILILITRHPDAAMDMLQVLGRHFHAAQHLVRLRAYRNPNDMIEEQATLGERMADGVAAFGGSWKFIISFGIFFAVYTILSHELGPRSWDPYPFILLNLFLSMLAAIQAPVIMMSQNRQDKKDRLRGEMDFEVNRHAHHDIQGLARKLNTLGDRLGDIEDALRARG
jgi:CRP/FNR family cyclic AMP-dependent transcriptional regulator